MTHFSWPEHTDENSLLREFFDIKSRADLSNLFGIKTQKLVFLLYGERKYKKQYRKFEISKKNGKKRTILAPVSSIKILQRKLNHILQIVYKPNVSAHGFILKRNILSNAKIHVRRRVVLNLDLKDFFPSINFGRVRGLFLSNPFSFNSEIATILAQLCCYEGTLPQGAPTSPVLSNMLCVRLDRELRFLAKKTGCLYTRYADDITFSTDRSIFHSDIATNTFISEGIFELSLGSKLLDIIKANGFNINNQKVHISAKGKRKQVTGIVVNEKLNVSRLYVRKIRSMLYAWKKFGPEKALGMYSLGNRLFKDKISYRAIVKGKIDYLGQVRGKRDYIYNKFYNWFNELAETGYPKRPKNFDEELESSIFVVKCGEKQGTGFLLRGIGLITCYHVVDASPLIKVYKSSTRLLEHQFSAQIKFKDSTKDLAILKVDFPNEHMHCSLELSNSNIGIGTSLTCVGFSNHMTGESFQKNKGDILSIRLDKRENQFYSYASNLSSGQSGGVALDNDNRVAGVIAVGSENPGVPPRSAEMGIIPLDLLKAFIEEIPK